MIGYLIITHIVSLEPSPEENKKCYRKSQESHPSQNLVQFKIQRELQKNSSWAARINTRVTSDVMKLPISAHVELFLYSNHDVP